MAAEQRPVFTKVLTRSYLQGAALGLPGASFGPCFADADTEITLRNTAGEEVPGKVKKRSKPDSTSVRLEVTSGWGRFVKLCGLAEGDEVQVEHQPGDVLLVTVLTKAGAAAGAAGAAGASTAAAAAAAAAAGGSAEKAAGKKRKQAGKKDKKRKRAQKEDAAAAEGAAAAEQQQQQGRKRKGARAKKAAFEDEEEQEEQEEEQQQQQQQQGAAAAAQQVSGEGSGPRLQQDEPPYIRHSASVDEAAAGRTGEAEEEAKEKDSESSWAIAESGGGSIVDRPQQEPAGGGADAAGTPAGPKGAQQDNGGSDSMHTARSGSEGQGVQGDEGQEEGGESPAAAASRRPSKRAEAAAAAAAVVPSAEATPEQQAGSDAQGGSVRAGAAVGAAAALAAAQQMVGKDVILPSPPGLEHPWTVGRVTAAPADQPGTIRLEILPNTFTHLGKLVIAPDAPPTAAAADVVVVLPDALLGWSIRKLFPGFADGFYSGTVVDVIEDGTEPPSYVVKYEDGDTEEYEIQELAFYLLSAPTAAAKAAAAAAGGRKRSRAPSQRPAAAAGAAGGGGQRQAKLTGGSGRRGRSASGAAASSHRSGSAGLLELGAGREGQAVSQEEDFYAPGGAGHDRGVTAFDGKSSVQRPVGPWLADPKKGSVLGRTVKMDKRHLPDRALPEGAPTYRSPYVPGWLGVRICDEGSWTPEYSGQYSIVVYDVNAAVVYRLHAQAFDTVEEAAKLYDRVALCYSGDAADTNYPATDELLDELGTQEEGASKGVITLAARLLSLEQSIPSEAVATGATQEDWGAWESDVIDNYMCQRPTTAAPSALAAKLKWLLQQVHESGILPAYRGPPLEALLAACDECSEAGSVKEHYAPDAASCLACAKNSKSGDTKSFKHGTNKLSALLREVEEAVLSQDAFDSFAEGGTAEDADAAAEEEQKELDERLKAWQQGRPVPAPTAAAAGAATAANGAAANPGRSRNRGVTAPRRQPRPAAPAGARASAGGGLAARASAQRDEGVPPGLKVIVIGAGISGLKAAVDLERLGAEVTVLEARDRIGGRIHTYELEAAGMKRHIDLGATFVCGTSRKPPVNPIFQYVVDVLGLSLRPKKRDGIDATVVFDRQGKPVSEEVMLAAEEKYAEMLGELLERGTLCTSKTTTIGETIGAILDEMEITPAEREVVESYCCDLYVTTVESMSLKGMVSNGYDGMHELVVGGYRQVVEALRNGRVEADRAGQPLKNIRLSSVVDTVRLLPGGAGVEVEVEGQEEPLRAHAVLCTLPLGCLQKRSVRFDPPLPDYKARAMDGLGMGTENRVAMLFDEPFWPEGPHFLRPVDGRYTFVNMHALGVGNVLSAWVRPTDIAAFEAMSDAEILADAERALKQLYPALYRPPLSHVITRWSQDPFAYGAYSFVPPNGRKVYFDWLSFPVSGDGQLDAKQPAQGGRHVVPQTRLWFAGEHTHKDDAYTVHGAYLSGRREAVRIKTWWKNHHREVAQLAEQQQQQSQQQEAEEGGGEGRRGRAAAAAAARRAVASQL